MRRKIVLEQKIYSIFCLLFTVLLVVMVIFVKNKFFIGNVRDIEYVTQVNVVTYSVNSIKQVIQADGSSVYRVTFIDKNTEAPEFSVDMEALPSDMLLGTDYEAQWLHVQGTASNYTRSKDAISIKYYAEQNFDNTTVTQLKSDIEKALTELLSTRLSMLFYPCCIVMMLFYISLLYFSVTWSATIADKLFQPNTWDYIQADIDTHKVTVQPAVDLKTAIKPLCLIMPENKVIKHVATKELGTKVTKMQETADIMVNRKQTGEKRVMRKPQKIQPIQEDIHVDITKHKYKR